jgi:hypothetical protein
VEIVESLCDPNEDIMTHLKLEFVNGIPPFWDEDQVLRDVALGARFCLIIVSDVIGDFPHGFKRKVSS